MSSITDNIRAIIFDLEDVPMMDITGLVAFEGAINKLAAHHRKVFLVGLKQQPAVLLSKSDVFGKDKGITICATVQEALDQSELHIASGNSRHVA